MQGARRWLGVVAIGLLVSGCGRVQSTVQWLKRPRPGQRLPTASLPQLGGGTLRLPRDARGRATLVLVWHPSYPDSLAAIAELQELQREPAAAGTRLFTIASGAAAPTVAASLTQAGLQAPVAVDANGRLAGRLNYHGNLLLLANQRGILALAEPWSLDAKQQARALLARWHGQPLRVWPAQSPLPAGPEAYTGDKLRADQERYYRHVLADAYEQCGPHQAAWDGDARRYIALHVQRLAGACPPAEAAAAPALAERLRRQQPTDPLVQYLLASWLLDSDRTAAAQPLLAAAVKGFEAAGYPATTRFLAPYKLAKLLPNARQTWTRRAVSQARAKGAAKPPPQWSPGPQEQMRRLGETWLLEALAAPVERPCDLRFVLTRVEAAVTVSSERRALADRLANTGVADRWVEHVLRGRGEVELAWDARGGGYAGTVTDTGWQGFAAHLERARRELTEAYVTHPELPEPAVDMIAVAKGGHAAPGDTTRSWFDRAVAAQFDLTAPYDDLLDALLPRWGGSHEAMLAFGRECLATGRFDTSVPGEFYVAVRTIAQRDERPESWADEQVQRDLDTLFDGLAADSHQAAGRAADQSRRAAALWAGRRYGEAEQVVAKLGSKLWRNVFRQDFEEDPDLALGQLHALARPATAKLAAAAEEAYQSHGPAAAQHLFKQARAQADRAVIPYLDDRLWQCAAPQQLAQGHWVNLLPPAGLCSWRLLSGNWWRLADGGVQVAGQPGEDGLAAELQWELTPPLTVRLEVEPPATGLASLLLRLTTPEHDVKVLLRAACEGRTGRLFVAPGAAQAYPDGPPELLPRARHNLELTFDGQQATLQADHVIVDRATGGAGGRTLRLNLRAPVAGYKLRHLTARCAPPAAPTTAR